MLKFIRDWGVFILIILLVILSRIFIWDTVSVDGTSMDPTLANGQRLVMTKVGAINRFDIVVAKETTAQTQKNDPQATSGITIVKRVIGMPGDTITYKDDTLYINGKEYNEPYLDSYKKLFATITDNGASNALADLYATFPLNGSLNASQRNYFVQLAKNTKAFTTDSSGNPNFTIHVPAGQYLLLGDDRAVSADSRKVGTFSRSQILGKPILRFWPLNKIGIL